MMKSDAAVIPLPSNRRWARRSGGLVGLAVLSLLTATIGRAQDVATQQRQVNQDDVLEWVDQLDATKASERAAAEAKLIAAGVEVLEFLPEQRGDFSVEAAERFERVKKALQEAKATQQTDAIRVRLDDAKTLDDALEQISRESGIEFEHHAEGTTPIQAPGAPLSFWHAVDLVLDQSELDINHYAGDSQTLVLVPRSKNRRNRVDSAAYSGVYRIETTSINARRVFNQPEQSGLSLSMQITWQPGITPIGLTIPIQQISGKFEDGEKVIPQATGGTIDVSTNRDLAFSEFYLPLELPVESHDEIRSLSGKIQSLLPGKRHAFELPLDKPAEPKTKDAMTVQLDQVRQNGDLYEVRLSVEIDDADKALESHRQWIFQNPVTLKDHTGTIIDHLGYELYRQTENSIGIGYLFDLERVEGASLLYESPTSVVKNEVTFVLQDIALP
jgi:hypothetical protein